MILQSIRVEGWRCFAAPVEVGPFIAGLNIIYGPNGIGKSTLLTALTRGLFDSHNVGGTDIKSLRPWGRSLAPKVTIEFEHDGQQFRLHKQFLSSESARLDRKEDGSFVPFAEDRAADDKARELFSGDAPGRGASDQRHWGLAQILWATQGRMQIEQLSSGTRATIQSALGAQIAGPGTQVLEMRIAEEYEQFFTAKGKLKSGVSAPAIVGLDSQFETAKSTREILRKRLDEFDAASRRIEDLYSKTTSARLSEQELNEKLNQARQQVQVYNQLVSQQQLHQQEVSAAEARYREHNERIQSIRAAIAERDAITRDLKRLQDNSPMQATLVEQCKQEAYLAEQKVKEIRGRRGDVATARQLAQMAERFARSKGVLDEFDKRIKQLEEVQGEIQQLRDNRDKFIAPDKKALAKITKVARQRDDARLRMDAALITVTLQLETESQIEVSIAEVIGTRLLVKGESHEIKGAPDVVLRIPGVGQFRATGPTNDFAELRGQWESADAKFKELTAGFGSNDIATLDKLRAQADELETKLSQAEVKMSTILGGENLDDLRRRRLLAANTLNEILSEHPGWKDAPPDPIEISRQAEATENQFTGDIDRAEAAKDLAQEKLQYAVQQQTSQQAKAGTLETQVAAIETRLELLRNDELDDKQRAEELTQIALRLDTARGKLRFVGEKVREYGTDPSKSLTLLEGQQGAFRNEAAAAERQLNIETGRLEQIISEAPYSALAEIEETIDRLQDEIARQQLQIDAIRLLFETFNDKKQDVIQSVLGPIRVRANHFLQRIAGTRFDGVHFDESLLPSGISPRSVVDSVSLDQISGGEREQVYFAVRMALADVVFNKERQLVVLDDVFTYTDTTRLARIATILDEAAVRFQIVLLTCHPERYRGLPNAKFFDLEAIVTNGK